MPNHTIIKLVAFIFFCHLTLYSQAQKTFSIDKNHLDSLAFGKYKSYIVSNSFDINFIGRQIPIDKRFTPDTSQIGLTEKAIRTQYYNARVRQLDSQWQQMKEYKDSYDWKLAVKQHKRSRPKMLANFKKQQQKDLDNYDRYFYGYINDIGEQIILIQFDPHVITYFTIADEQHINNLPLMVYNTKTKILSLSGWD
jgi:hypothetical protein